MPDFKDLKSIKSWLQQKINSALINEVAETVKEVEQEKIEETVYDAYSPRYYIRRGSSGGGLGNLDNMTSSLVDIGVLEVQNTTPPNQNYKHDALKSPYIDTAVAYGERYDFYNPGARNYAKATVDELQNSDKLLTSLKKGLKRQGVKTD